MKIVCPVCGGLKVAPHSNGVDPQKKQELYPCWMCDEHGEVEEHPTEKMQIRKYWNVELADSI
jgi:transcription elongation factor Elf1